MGQKQSSNSRGYFAIAIAPVALMQRNRGSPETAIDYKLWSFGTSMAFSTMCIEPVNYREAETVGNSTLTVVPRSCVMASVPLI
jgi:hypothetical protein